MYVGPRGVTHVVIDEMKTYSGAEVVTVHYDGGYSELMTKKTYELVSTKEPSDYTAIRNVKYAAMNKEIYPIIAEYVLAIAPNVGLADAKKDARHDFLGKALAMMTEFDIKVSEIESFLNPIIAELNGAVNAIGYEMDNTFNRATNYLWTKNDGDFIPGTNMILERTLLEAKKVNSEIPAPAATGVEEVKADEAAPTTDESESSTTA